MDVHVLQHVPFEGPGYVERWCRDQGAKVSFTRFYEPDYRLRAPAEPDLVVVMGGPMSVNDESEYPWLSAEKEFIAARVKDDRPTLGICLGAQLIAAALGSKVYPGEPEIGWFPVQAVESSGFAFPQRFWALHWHGETFDLPAEAEWLARTEPCPNQAFQVGRRTIALQFHLETTPELLEGLVKHSEGDLQRQSPYVQDRETILSAPPERYAELHSLMAKILEYLLGT